MNNLVNNLDEDLIRTIDFWKNIAKSSVLFARGAKNKVDLNSDEIIVVIGPRRSGKSSFLQLFMQELPEKSWVYINFEDPFFIENKNPEIIEDIINVYLENFSQNLKYLFFDEIQNIQNWERVVRKYQETKKYKIFVTGSSSKLLSQEFSTVLTGRHKTIKILPLDFVEYLQFNKVDFEKKADLVLQESKIQKLFQEYLNLGGFPKIVLDKKPEVLKQYFYDIIQKDIVGRHDVRQREKIERLGNYLLSNIAKVYSVRALSKTFELSWEYISLYIEYFKEAFILKDLVPKL
jgi:predicted AAA+ superfamily ATPase